LKFEYTKKNAYLTFFEDDNDTSKPFSNWVDEHFASVADPEDRSLIENDLIDNDKVS
jgi:hypothetical protein